MKSLFTALWLGASSLVLAHATPVNIQASLGHYWQDTLLPPQIDKFTEAASQLAAQSAQLCERPTLAKLDAARAAWRDGYVAWRAIEALPLGPAAAAGLQSRLDTWPTSTPQIEAAVRDMGDTPALDPVTPEAARGLPAIEYLLWGDDRPGAQLGRLSFRKRCTHLLAQSTALASEAAALRAAWQSQKPVEPAQRFKEGYTALIDAVHTVREKKLPTPKPGGKLANRQDFDAWRSHNTHAGIAMQVAMIEAALLKGPGNANLAQGLAASGQASLAQALQQAIDDIRQALGDKPRDLPELFSRQPTAAKPLKDALARLEALLTGPVAAAFGATVAGQ
jgi:hypothetical protein